MFEKAKKILEKKTEAGKIKILNEYFHDDATELRMFKADDYVSTGKAKNFRDACKIIKEEEKVFAEKMHNRPRKYKDFSEQEKDLVNYLKSNGIEQ